VAHGAVEVDLVGDAGGAQLGEVEMGVAAHQRVEGPEDAGEAEGARPAALMQLERGAHALVTRLRGDAEDVAVQCARAAVVAEKADRAADDAVVEEGG